MAVYDRQGASVLGFHNPAGTIIFTRGLYSYLVGNTRGRELTENFGTDKNQHLDLLLLASGDVKNVLFTVSGWLSRKPNDRPKSVSFHLNDYDPSVVARNAVVLEIANTINPDVQGDVDFLWNVWYNMALSKAHFVRLQAVLFSLVERNFDGESFLKFQDSNVLQECQAIWKDWRELNLDVDSVKEERKRLIKNRSDGMKVEDLCLNVLLQIMMAPYGVEFIVNPSSPFYQEIRHWYQESSTNDEQHSVNPTMIRPFVHKWKVHYLACAFEAYLPLPRKDLVKYGSFSDSCKEKLRLLVKRFQRFRSASSLEVTLYTSDGLLLCTSGFPQDLKFDVIDTSNVSDHIGLLNVLVCCIPRLKRPQESQLFTSSMLWQSGCESIMEYYNRSIGIHAHLLPTILGLKLAVDFDLGNRLLPHSVKITEDIFCWVNTEESRTMITLEEGSDVIQALVILAERCFDLHELLHSKGQCFGANMSSPRTFLRILHQLHPVIDGGAPRILDFVRKKLPSNFEEKFGLSWNLINGALGSK